MNDERPKFFNLFTESFSYYLPILKVAFPLILLFRLPGILFSEALHELWLPKNLKTMEQIEASMGVFVNFTIIQSLLEILFGTIVSIAIIKAILARRENKPIKATQVLKEAFPLWTEGIATIFIMTLILILLSYLLIIPAIIWGIFYIFTLYVVAIEGIGGRAALKRSKSLVKGHWFEVFAYVLIINIALFFVGIVMMFPTGFLVGALEALKEQSWIHSGFWYYGLNIFFNSMGSVIFHLVFVFNIIFMTLYFLDSVRLEKKPI